MGGRGWGYGGALDRSAGRPSGEEAIPRPRAGPRQFAKRQATWFRHRRMAPEPHTHSISARVADFEQFSDAEAASIMRFVREAG